MIYVSSADTYDFPDLCDPYLQGRLLGQLFPHLCRSAAEDMLGDLAGPSTNRAAGPAFSQLFEDDDAEIR